MSSEMLNLTEEHRARLSDLRQSEKFAEDLAGLYPGAATPELGKEFEERANLLISQVSELASNSTKDDVFTLFSATLRKFDHADTEDRERICGVCEDIMDAVGIDSSEGLLNKWLYGFDPTEFDSNA